MNRPSLACAAFRLMVWVLATVLSAGAMAASEFSTVAVRDASRLVVMLDSNFSEGDRIGSGIIVGVRQRSLFIATANHNVRWGSSAALEVKIRLRSSPDTPLRATVLPAFDAQLDLAFLRVDDVAPEATPLPLYRVSDGQGLEPGDSVYPMGNGTRPWALGQYSDSLEERHGDLLIFQSDFIRPGQSGGALWNQGLELVGLIRADQPPDGIAIAMSKVLERARSWNIPVSLSSDLLNTRFIRVAAGSSHACALATTGELYCLGENRGQLGDGTEMNSPKPRKVLGEHLFTEVGVGRDASCALDRKGSVWCWGSDIFNELGGGAREQRDVFIQRIPIEVIGGHRYKSLSVRGMPLSCALEVSGLTWCWGDMERRLRGPRRSGGGLAFTSIHVGEQGACGLTQEGVAYCWNLNPNRSEPLHEPSPLPGAPRFRTLAVGGDSRIVGCGLTDKLMAYCWGTNLEGQLGNGKGDVTPITSANDSAEPVPVAGQHEFQGISVGTDHACGVTRSGQGWCWGRNQDGQIGDGSTRNRSTPTMVAGNHAFVQISAGDHLTCGVTTGGVLLCWGKWLEESVTRPARVSGQGQ